MMALILLTDPVYYMPKFKDLKEFIRDDLGNEREFVDNLYACEEFSLSFLVALRQKRADDYLNNKLTNTMNWAVGLVFTQSHSKLHYQNIAITEDQGVLLIEPQADKILHAGMVSLEAHYVFM